MRSHEELRDAGLNKIASRIGVYHRLFSAIGWGPNTRQAATVFSRSESISSWEAFSEAKSLRAAETQSMALRNPSPKGTSTSLLSVARVRMVLYTNTFSRASMDGLVTTTAQTGTASTEDTDSDALYLYIKSIPQFRWTASWILV